jgi:predicted permease
MIGTAIALLLFITELPLPTDVGNMITTTAKMSTPISMIIMGMRLGTMNLGRMFTNVRVYATIFAKQIIMPLIALLLVVFLPVSYEVKSTFFIVCACPVASVTLNYAEIVGEGQEEAASMLLVGTMLSIVTLPLLVLLLPLLA